MPTPGGPELFHEPVCVCFSIEKPLKCGPCCREADSIFGAVSKTVLLAQEEAVVSLGDSGETGTNQNQSREHAIPQATKEVTFCLLCGPAPPPVSPNQSQERAITD